MDREHVLHWLHEHPESVHGDVDLLCARCERAARLHAAEDAWIEARHRAEECMHRWEHQWGFHASEAYVAREACGMVARDLKGHEPHPHRGDEEHLVGRKLLEQLEPEAREALADWIVELADAEMHRTWREIVRYTEHRAATLRKEGRLSEDLDWEETANFKARAARIAALLMGEFGAHAKHPRAH
jgi:hypothetical protein